MTSAARGSRFARANQIGYDALKPTATIASNTCTNLRSKYTYIESSLRLQCSAYRPLDDVGPPCAFQPQRAISPGAISPAPGSPASSDIASPRQDGESQVPEDSDGPRLAALEITRSEAPSSGKFVCRTEDRFRRVRVVVPDKVIRRGRGETMLSKELLWPEPIVIPAPRAAPQFASRAPNLL